MRSALLFVAVTFAVLLVGCASKPCSVLRVVQYTDKPRETDMELDDGHVYAIPYTPPGDDPFNPNSIRRHPDTGDEVTLCSLKATDGSQHYSLHIGTSTIVTPTLVR